MRVSYSNWWSNWWEMQFARPFMTAHSCALWVRWRVLWESLSQSAALTRHTHTKWPLACATWHVCSLPEILWHGMSWEEQYKRTEVCIPSSLGYLIEKQLLFLFGCTQYISITSSTYNIIWIYYDVWGVKHHILTTLSS